MSVLHYLLIICGLFLLIYYIIYHIGKHSTIKINILLFIPLIISIIIVYKYIDIDIPFESRYVEYKAESMREYHKNNNHDKYYTMVYKDYTNTEKEYEISVKTYNYFYNLWTKDGDSTIIKKKCYKEIFWDKNKPYNSLICTTKESYSNYFKNARYLYALSHISDDKAVKIKLFPRGRLDYLNQDTILEPRQSLIYGITLNDSINRSFSSNIGSYDKKFRPVLLVWIGKGNSSAKINGQRNYWNGGNDNEAIFCIGISDTITKKIIWSGSFSWADNKDLENYVLKTALRPGNTLNISDYEESLTIAFDNGLWSPRDFESYSFLKLPIKNLIIIFIFSVIILLNIIISFKLIKKKKDNLKSEK